MCFYVYDWNLQLIDPRLLVQVGRLQRSKPVAASNTLITDHTLCQRIKKQKQLIDSGAVPFSVLRNRHFSPVWYYLYRSKKSVQSAKKKPRGNSHPILDT
jgi:hypothetical protein